jgi:hypothetical protein
MNRIKRSIFFLALGLSIGAVSPGCATVGPIAIKCGPGLVTVVAADYAEISADLHAKPVNYSDLAVVAERIGWATADCILGDVSAKDPTVVPAVQEFKRQHAVEFRAAGVSACNDSRPPKALQAAASPRDTADGKLSLADCAARAGTSDVIAPPSGCWAWRADRKDWRRSMWVRL